MSTNQVAALLETFKLVCFDADRQIVRLAAQGKSDTRTACPTEQGTLEEGEDFTEVASTEAVSITEAVSATIAITTTIIMAAGGGGGGVDPATTMEVPGTTRTAVSGAALAAGSGWWSPW